MNVLIIGANGFLGPHVVRALEGRYTMRLTDVRPPPPGVDHDWRQLDISDYEQVHAAAEGMDAILNLSVLRADRKLAWDVNALGTHNVLRAAVERGIRRVINTGPQAALSGRTYEAFDYGMHADIPPKPNTRLYPLSKGVGLEMCKLFAARSDLYVMTFLYLHFRYDYDRPDDEPEFKPYVVWWDDAATMYPLALDIDLTALPSRCEEFMVSADVPGDHYRNDKVKRVFGWQPTHNFERFWVRGFAPSPLRGEGRGEGENLRWQSSAQGTP